MQIDLLTLFPSTFSGYLDQPPHLSAIRNGLVQVRTHNFCQWADPQHPITQPTTTRYGRTMVLTSAAITACAESVRRPDCNACIVVLSTHGRRFDQDNARELSRIDQLVLVCGRLGGFEDGLADRLGADEISVGDYVLNCGEVAAMVVMDAVIRLIPGVIGGPEAMAVPKQNLAK